MTQDSGLNSGERYNDSSGVNQIYANDSAAQSKDKLTKGLKNHPQYNTPEMKIPIGAVVINTPAE